MQAARLQSAIALDTLPESKERLVAEREERTFTVPSHDEHHPGFCFLSRR